MKKKKQKLTNTQIALITITILIMIMFAWLVYSTFERKQLTEKCKEFQNSESLAQPCVCYPSEKPADLETEVDIRTTKFCRCDCQISDNQTFSTWVLIAKEK